MARVLVTGATGCLGHRLALDLAAAGHEVIAQGRNRDLATALVAAGVRFLATDLRQPLPPAALQGVEVVHHCAALSTAWGRAQDFTAINVTATAALLQAARKAGVGRFVFASSPSIYADGRDRFDLDEDAPLPARFSGAYAASKFAAEARVLAADDPAGMRCLALRPRAIYGRGDRSLMPRLLAAVARGRVPMINGGQSLIDITHVGDAARAMALAAAPGAPGGRAYNITSGRAYRFAALLDAVCALAGATPRRIPLRYGTAMMIARGLEAAHHLFAPGREPVLTRQAVASLGRSLTLDISRAGQELGYRPQVTLHEGIRDYADAV